MREGGRSENSRPPTGRTAVGGPIHNSTPSTIHQHVASLGGLSHTQKSQHVLLCLKDTPVPTKKGKNE